MAILAKMAKKGQKTRFLHVFACFRGVQKSRFRPKVGKTGKNSTFFHYFPKKTKKTKNAKTRKNVFFRVFSVFRFFKKNQKIT